MKLYIARHRQTIWNAQNKVCGMKVFCIIICELFIILVLTGCYTPAQLVDDLLGRRRNPMTETEAKQWLEENYTHDMTILECVESETQVRFIIQDNNNGEKFELINNNDGVAGWTCNAIYDEEDPERTRKYNEHLE